MIKLAGALILVAALAGVGVYVKHKFDLAAEVPQLNQEISDRDARISHDTDLAKDIQKLYQANEADRTAAEQAYNAWENGQAQLFQEIRRNGANTAAARNPICLPSAADRQLRNSAFSSFGPNGTGQAKAATPMPKSP